MIGGVIDLRFPGLNFQHRFDEPIEWAMSPQTSIKLATNPSVGSPWPLRWVFTCPRCGARSRLKNSQMLDLFLRALYTGRREIRPGKIR